MRRTVSRWKQKKRAGSPGALLSGRCAGTFRHDGHQVLGEQLDVGVQRLADDVDVTLQPINLGAEFLLGRESPDFVLGRRSEPEFVLGRQSIRLPWSAAPEFFLGRQSIEICLSRQRPSSSLVARASRSALVGSARSSSLVARASRSALVGSARSSSLVARTSRSALVASPGRICSTLASLRSRFSRCLAMTTSSMTRISDEKRSACPAS